jgi:hypothetical protein
MMEIIKISASFENYFLAQSLFSRRARIRQLAECKEHKHKNKHYYGKRGKNDDR